MKKATRADASEHLRLKRGFRAFKDVAGKAEELFGDALDPGPKPLPVSEAKARLHSTIAGFNDRAFAGEKSFQVAAVCTPGLGKSHDLIDDLRRRLKADAHKAIDEPIVIGKVWYSTPNIRLATELAEYYGHGAVVVRGRTQGDQPLCARKDVVTEAINAGVRDIGRAFCAGTDANGHEVRCPFFDDCSYWDQFATAASAEIIFLSHEYLLMPISRERLPAPDLLIVDENPINAVLSLPARFTPQAVRESAGDNLALAEIVLDAFDAGSDPRQALRDAGWNATAIRRVVAELDKARIATLDPGMSDDEVRGQLKAAKSSRAALLLRRVAAEFEAKHQLRGAYLTQVGRKTRDGPEVAPVIYCQHRKQIRIPASVPVLVLDGTAAPQLLKGIWPNIDVVEIEAERTMRLGHITGQSMSKTMLLGKHGNDRAEEIADYTIGLATPGLLIGPLDWVETVTLPAGWTAEHFGNLRGVNTHKTANSVVIVGRSLIRVEVAERQARALFFDRDDVSLKLGHPRYLPQPIRLRGTDSVVYDLRHPDPLVDLFRAAWAEREIEQAVDRLRLVHRKRRRRVVVIGNTPTRLPVNDVADYRDVVASKIMRAFRRSGFLVLRPDLLAAGFPEFWPNSKAAENDIARFRLADIHVCAWEFRLEGRRGGRPSRALTSTAMSQEQVASRLADLLGRPVATLTKELYRIEGENPGNPSEFKPSSDSIDS